MTDLYEIINKKRELDDEKKLLNEKSELFKVRCVLKDLILNIDKIDLNMISKYYSEIYAKFLNQYKIMLLKDRIKYPNFIFDSYDEELFSICYKMFMDGIILSDIEKNYVSNLKKDYVSKAEYSLKKTS